MPPQSTYTPDPALSKYLAAGPLPIYIGFGSIVVGDPVALNETIMNAVQMAGVRAIISKGWGGIGCNDPRLPENVFVTDDVPHEWLFPHVSAVVHHGGAGTTAAGIAAGKPTVVVPFFGDQPFWGSVIAEAGAGPQPIPFATLTASNLAQAIQFALQPATLSRAQELGTLIAGEEGCEIGAQKFHSTLR